MSHNLREPLSYFILTLFVPAYFHVSGTRGGHIVPPLRILGLGGVRVPILFGNDLLWNIWPYSKGFMKFGSLELKYFEGCRLTQVVRNFGISDEHYFFAET